jgi:uncharacterized protein YbjT (DUF2867 family)
MSRILIVGASGFVGKHLATALAEAGHAIICAIRQPPPREKWARFTYVQVDYTCDITVNDWKGMLSNVDVAINAVGIIREHGRQSFEALHERGPKALFTACTEANIQVIQISALGADNAATSRYHLSKKAADDYLLSITSKAVIVQPSLIYGPGGTSAGLFNLLASLPAIPLPGAGDQKIQPIHISDLIQAIEALINNTQYFGRRVCLVGPKPLTLQRYLEELRHMMGLGPGRFIHIPTQWIECAARMGKWLKRGIFDIDTWQMLKRGNVADCDTTRILLNREPRAVSQFASDEEAKYIRLSAFLGWLQLVLRFSIAIVWLVAGIVSMGIYPVEDSYVLLARVGITGMLAPVALYGAAALDMMFGIATLFLRQRRLLWIAQASVIAIYTIIITIFLPEFWLHPFGPLVKNLPILAAILLLYKLEPR